MRGLIQGWAGGRASTRVPSQRGIAVAALPSLTGAGALGAEPAGAALRVRRASTGAARALQLSQPTLGRHIAELEAALGVVLPPNDQRPAVQLVVGVDARSFSRTLRIFEWGLAGLSALAPEKSWLNCENSRAQRWA